MPDNIRVDLLTGSSLSIRVRGDSSVRDLQGLISKDLGVEAEATQRWLVLSLAGHELGLDEVVPAGARIRQGFPRRSFTLPGVDELFRSRLGGLSDAFGACLAAPKPSRHKQFCKGGRISCHSDTPDLGDLTTETSNAVRRMLSDASAPPDLVLIVPNHYTQGSDWCLSDHFGLDCAGDHLFAQTSVLQRSLVIIRWRQFLVAMCNFGISSAVTLTRHRLEALWRRFSQLPGTGSARRNAIKAWLSTLDGTRFVNLYNHCMILDAEASPAMLPPMCGDAVQAALHAVYCPEETLAYTGTALLSVLHVLLLLGLGRCAAAHTLLNNMKWCVQCSPALSLLRLIRHDEFGTCQFRNSALESAVLASCAALSLKELNRLSGFATAQNGSLAYRTFRFVPFRARQEPLCDEHALARCAKLLLFDESERLLDLDSGSMRVESCEEPWTSAMPADSADTTSFSLFKGQCITITFAFCIRIKAIALQLTGCEECDLVGWELLALTAASTVVTLHRFNEPYCRSWHRSRFWGPFEIIQTISDIDMLSILEQRALRLEHAMSVPPTLWSQTSAEQKTRSRSAVAIPRRLARGQHDSTLVSRVASQKVRR